MTLTTLKEGDNPEFDVVAKAWIESASSTFTPTQKQKMERMLLRHLAPIGGIAIDQLSVDAVMKELCRLHFDGSLEVASRARLAAFRVFDYAVGLGLISCNPLDDVELCADGDYSDWDFGDDDEGFQLSDALSSLAHRKKVSASASDTAKAVDGLSRAMAAIIASDKHRVTKAAIIVTLLTYQKAGPIREARWDDITLNSETKSGVWVIPKEKTTTGKPHLVPIIREAYSVLRDLKKHTGRQEFVFPSPAELGQCISDNAVRKAMVDLGFKLSSVHVRNTVKSHFTERGGCKVLMRVAQGLAVDGADSSTIDWDEQACAVARWWSDELLKGVGVGKIPEPLELVG